MQSSFLYAIKRVKLTKVAARLQYISVLIMELVRVKQEKGVHQKHCSLLGLSDEVLAQLLGHVHVQQRLKVLATVCKRFRAAAAAATKDIKLHTTSMSAVFGLQSWLKMHGATVSSLDLKPPVVNVMRPFALLELPCPNLCSLHLTNTLVQFTSLPGSQQPGVLDCCTALTSLSLHNCNVLDTSKQLAGLSVLQHLEELIIQGPGPTSAAGAPQQTLLLPGSLLSQLVKLTSIHLKAASFSHLQHLSCLTSLQDLNVMLAAAAPQEKFTGAKHLQHLTCLHLDCSRSMQIMGFNETRGLCTNPALRELKLWRCSALKAALLRHLPTLCDVRILDCNLGGAEGTSRMLGVLPLLPAITHLDLSGTLQDPAAHLSDYTALAALPELQTLSMARCQLPAGMLQRLALNGVCMSSVWSLGLDYTTPGLSTADLSSLVQCFPNLGDLWCTDATAEGTSLHPLQQLKDLCKLVISNISDAAVPALTTLKHLVTLLIQGPSSITDCGLLQLTALSSLTMLCVNGDLSGSVLAAAGSDLDDFTIEIFDMRSVSMHAGRTAQFSNTDQTVPQQLLQLCMNSSACQPELLQRLMQYPQLQSDLQATSRELTAVSAELDGMHANYRTLAGLNRQLQLQLDQEGVAARDRKLLAAAKEEEVSKREEALAAERTALSTRSAELDALKRQLKSRAKTLDARGQQATADAISLANQQQELHNRQRSLESRGSKLGVREHHVAAIEQRLGNVAAREQNVANLEARLGSVAAREQRVAAQEAQLRVHNQQQMMQMQIQGYGQPVQVMYQAPQYYYGQPTGYGSG